MKKYIRPILSIVLFLTMLIGCVENTYEYRELGYKEYILNATSASLQSVSPKTNLNECYYINRCEQIVKMLIDKIVVEQLVPQKKCMYGYTLQNNRIEFHEGARVYATFQCNEGENQL